jgi:hypothetical protein
MKKGIKVGDIENLLSEKIDAETSENFCGECGLSLKPFDFVCQVQECKKCTRKVYYQRKAIGGGFRVEEGEQLHISGITMSLNPMEGGRKNHLTRYGLEALIKQYMADGGYTTPESFLEYCKQREKELDKELLSLEYLNHLDLDTNEGVEEAIKILDREGADEYKAKLHTSSSFGDTHRMAVEGNFEKATEKAFTAGIFVNFQLLENPHFKEIIWLGYQAYANLTQNEGISHEEAQEKLLVDQVANKLRSFSDAHLLSLSQADDPISIPLGVNGVREKGLHALVVHEIERRKKATEEKLRNREVTVKEKESKLKQWGLVLTVVNVTIGILVSIYVKST